MNLAAVSSCCISLGVSLLGHVVIVCPHSPFIASARVKGVSVLSNPRNSNIYRSWKKIWLRQGGEHEERVVAEESEPAGGGGTAGGGKGWDLPKVHRKCRP